MNFSLTQALSHLRKQIEGFEKRKTQSTSKYDRDSWDDIIAWMFERGLNMITFARPGEVDQEMIDYFLGRSNERPDLKKLKRLLEEKNNSAE